MHVTSYSAGSRLLRLLRPLRSWKEGTGQREWSLRDFEERSLRLASSLVFYSKLEYMGWKKESMVGASRTHAAENRQLLPERQVGSKAWLHFRPSRSRWQLNQKLSDVSDYGKWHARALVLPRGLTISRRNLIANRGRSGSVVNGLGYLGQTGVKELREIYKFTYIARRLKFRRIQVVRSQSQQDIY